MSLFSFAVSCEASLPAQKPQISITQRHQATPPKTKSYCSYFQLVTPENSPKATMQVSGEATIRPRSSRPPAQSSDADCSIVPPPLTLFKQTAVLIGNLTPSLRQLYVAEGERKISNSTNRRQLEPLIFCHTIFHFIS